MKKKTVAACVAGAVIGAGLALHSSHKEKKDERTERQERGQNAEPISQLLGTQINTELLTGGIIRKWFADAAIDGTKGKAMAVVQLKDMLLSAFGYYADVEVDRDHYVLCKILDQPEKNAVLINFEKITPELRNLLEKGNGILKVTGDAQDCQKEDHDHE